MRGKDIIVGGMVVPVIKTIDGPLGKSKEWEAAQEKGQEYLWVIAVNTAQKVFTCAMTKTAKVGDKFAAIDLRSLDWEGWPSRVKGFVHTHKGDKPKVAKAPAKAAPKAAKAAKAAKAPAKAAPKSAPKPKPKPTPKPAKVEPVADSKLASGKEPWEA